MPRPEVKHPRRVQSGADMAKLSAGLLLFRKTHGEVEVMLVHPGGPLWATKDEGAWSIPKGEYLLGEDPFAAARREFTEETGFEADGRFVALGQVKQPGGKLVTAWALEKDLDVSRIRSNSFSMEWPPRSGRIEHFPEVDRGEWFSLGRARGKIGRGQIPFLDRLVRETGTVDEVEAGDPQHPGHPLTDA